MSTSPRRRRAPLLVVLAGTLLALLGAGLPAQADDDAPQTPSAGSDPSPSPSETTTDGATPSPSSEPTDGESTGADPDSTGNGANATAAASPLHIWPRARLWQDLNGSHVYDNGDTYRYTYAINNTGSRVATNMKASLQHGFPCYVAGNATTLAPGATTTCTSWVMLYKPAAGYANWATVSSSNVGSDVSTRDWVSAPCSYNAPRYVAPGDGSYFNYPFSGYWDSNAIRFMVLRTINSVPKCESIRIATFAINDAMTVDALIAAYRRGVLVQVIGDSHLIRGDRATQSPSFKRLMATIGSSTRNRSWVKVCSYSCRGSGGNHHYKMYLFSRAYNKYDVTMVGSANLTIKAQSGQWNHLDVRTSGATWAKYTSLMPQLAADRRAQYPWQVYTDITPQTWVFPRTGTTARTDPMMTALNKISCTGGSVHKRTVIRIGAYAWFEERGVWLAQKVRQLWNSGCDVMIEYAVMGNTTKQILYSPSGRGRIPMRQVVTFYSDGEINAYDHAKYVTIAGKYSGNPNAYVTWTGTTNFTNLGFSSDDMTTVWFDYYHWSTYLKSFSRVWGGPYSRVPSPTSRVPGELNTGAMTFGQGNYTALDQP